MVGADLERHHRRGLQDLDVDERPGSNTISMVIGACLCVGSEE